MMALHLLEKRNDLSLYEESSFNLCDDSSRKFNTLIAKEFASICHNYSLNTKKILFAFDHHLLKQIIFHTLEVIADSIYLKELLPDGLLLGENIADLDYIVSYDHNLYLIKIRERLVEANNGIMPLSSVFNDEGKNKFPDSILLKFKFSVVELIDNNLFFLFYQRSDSNATDVNDLSKIMVKHKDYCSSWRTNWNCLWLPDPKVEKKQTENICCGVSIFAKTKIL